MFLLLKFLWLRCSWHHAPFRTVFFFKKRVFGPVSPVYGSFLLLSYSFVTFKKWFRNNEFSLQFKKVLRITNFLLYYCFEKIFLKKRMIFRSFFTIMNRLWYLYFFTNKKRLYIVHFLSTFVTDGGEEGGKESGGVAMLKAECSVCGSPAAAHLHYGAISCYSCRAFFRRGPPRQIR